QCNLKAWVGYVACDGEGANRAFGPREVLLKNSDRPFWAPLVFSPKERAVGCSSTPDDPRWMEQSLRRQYV
ncbi:MAG: hypothetical protein ACK43N_25465, partial [Pirellulaceae bacterium]